MGTKEDIPFDVGDRVHPLVMEQGAGRYESGAVEEDVEGTRQPVKKRTTFSSTAETLKWARGIWGEERVGISSWWQSTGKFGGVRKDLLGFIDCVVLDGQPGVLALQACGADVGAHQRKMEGRYLSDGRGNGAAKKEKEAAQIAARVRAWLLAGNRLLIVAWRPIWVQKSKTHKVKKMTPRFIEGVLTPHPPGLTLGASDRELEWVEHDQWPLRAEEGR